MKDLKINKELIEIILNCEIEDFEMFSCDLLMYYEKALFRANCQGQISNDRDSICCTINIHKFAYKCKRWLLKNNIAFTLNYYNDNSVQFYCEKYHLDIESSSEIEAIIKACERILENSK